MVWILRGGDEDINTIYTFTPTPPPIPLGPLTHVCAHQFNHQVSSFLNSRPSYLDNRDTCTLVLLRNDGEDQQGKVCLHSECETTSTPQELIACGKHGTLTKVIEDQSKFP